MINNKERYERLKEGLKERNEGRSRNERGQARSKAKRQGRERGRRETGEEDEEETGISEEVGFLGGKGADRHGPRGGGSPAIAWVLSPKQLISPTERIPLGGGRHAPNSAIVMTISTFESPWGYLLCSSGLLSSNLISPSLPSPYRPSYMLGSHACFARAAIRLKSMLISCMYAACTHVLPWKMQATGRASYPGTDRRETQATDDSSRRQQQATDRPTSVPLEQFFFFPLRA